MSVQLTIVKTNEEHWVQHIGLKDTFLKLEFAAEHQVSNVGERTIVKIHKTSELYRAFNENLNDVFNMGMEKALRTVLKELDSCKLDKKGYRSLKQYINRELEKEHKSQIS